MDSQENNQQKPGLLFSLYQYLFRLIGNRRYYLEFQKIHKTLNSGISGHYNTPSNRLVLKALVELIATIVKIKFQNILLVEQWYLLLCVGDGFSRSFDNYKPIIPPFDRFWADPHVVQKDNHYYIFVEEYLYSSRKARISVIVIDELGNQKDSFPVLEKNYHLSYPFTFKYEDKYYMVPESAENRTIDLYECIEFPYKWQFVMHLMENVTAVDTTLFYYSDKWWLFTAMPENPDSLPMVNLYLFSSEVFKTNNWKPHFQNPIVTDIASARPAGKIFARNGKIYRPSQDGSESYGYGLDINEISLISENKYLEKKTISIRPNWDRQIKGTHTFSKEGRLTVLDVYRRRPKILTWKLNGRIT